MTTPASRRGRLAQLAGLAAEDQVMRHYLRAGLAIVARRWRGRGGEIDLVARDGRELVFVEVKSAATHAAAAARLGAAQQRRLAAAAEEFHAGVAGGMSCALRFDVALVDAMGRIDVIENALIAA